MQLPFTIEFDFRTTLDLRRAARTRTALAIALCLLGVTAALTTWIVSQPDEHAAGNANLEVTSSPSGASILLESQAIGQTPARLSLPAGNHRVTLRLDQFADATRALTLATDENATLHLDLWLRSPTIKHLRPIFPGASIANATFLHDGSIALIVALPPTDERQLWVAESRGETRRLGPPLARGAIAVTPDEQRIAYLAHRQDSADGRLDQVWVWRSDGERALIFALPAASADERLVDLTFAPEGGSLLVVSRQQRVAGGTRTRMRSLDLGSGTSRDILTLPSDIVPGSYAWSPDGQWVALVTWSGQLTSLCLLQPSSGRFTYLADLSRDDPSPSPFPPLAWSSDSQRVLYAAPAPDRSATGWTFVKASPAFFIAPVDQSTPPIRISEENGQAASWRNEGSIATLGRKSNSVVVVKIIGPSGQRQVLAELPIKGSANVTARWDIAHAQLLLASRGSAGLVGSQPDYWLVQFQPEMAR